MLPINLRVSGATIVIVGGGTVARRKVQTILDAGARVHVIDPKPQPVDYNNLHNVVWLQSHYHGHFLSDARLVFAAATDEVNRQVVRDAQQRGIWVNSATDPQNADFDLPAVLRRGPLTIAASTAGVAPALAKRIREKLEHEFDHAYEEWLSLLQESRREILLHVNSAPDRHQLLTEFADWHWLDALRRDGQAMTRTRMQQMIQEKSLPHEAP